MAGRSRGVAREEELVDGLESAKDPASDGGLEEVNYRSHVHEQEPILRNPPLPIVDGLNPSRVRVETRGSAADIIRDLIKTQQHHAPSDDDAALAARFNEGKVCLDDGTLLRPDSEVPAGTFIWFYRRPAPERTVPGELQELYQDDRLLVVDKPPFMSTLPRGQHITETAVVRARRQFDMSMLSPAHRLDRLTRGILLFTTRQDVRGAYQRMFEARKVRKVYEAVTPIPHSWSDILERDELGSESPAPVPAGALATGAPEQFLRRPTPETPWVLRHHMVKLRGRMATYLTDDAPNSETVVTGLRVFSDGDQRLLSWTLEPRSGRTHQLRLNMRLFGCPIVGDPLYNFISDEALWQRDCPMPFVPAVADEDFGRPMGLTAALMSFTDPVSNEARVFKTRFPTSAV